MTKYVLYYFPSADVLEKAPKYFADHQARWKKYGEDGTLLMIGPFANPQEGSMAIFRTREAAQEFAKGDPFVANGVVANWVVREWNEALT